METRDYTVTSLAGPKVAGRVVARGATVQLTEPEARLELLAGAIVLDPAHAADPFKAGETGFEAKPPVAKSPPSPAPAMVAPAGGGAP